MNKETQPLTQEQIEAIKEVALIIEPVNIYHPPHSGDNYTYFDYNEGARNCVVNVLKRLTPELLDKLRLQQKDVSLINEANNHRIKPTKTQDSLQQGKQCKLKSDWIKIEEGCEMPTCDWDKTKYVLIAFNRFIYPSLFYQGKFFVIETWSEEGIESDTYNPTHWMPLPKKPTK